VNVQKTTTGFIPSPEHYDDFNSIKNGTHLTITIKKIRNVALFRKFFALINVAYENRQTMEDVSIDVFRKELTKRAGYYESYTDLKGNTIYIAKSIAFEKMDEKEFTELYNKVLDVILEKVLIGMKGDELNPHLERILAFD